MLWATASIVAAGFTCLGVTGNMKKIPKITYYTYICPNCNDKIQTDNPAIFNFCPYCDAPIDHRIVKYSEGKYDKN